MTRSILIVEDEAILARNIARLLERHGYEVQVASDGRSARKAFGTAKPDLILLDFNLPDVDGLSLLKEMVTADPWVAVVMMTAHGSVQLAVDAMKAGAADYLTKPVSLEELKLVVERTLEQTRMATTLSYYRNRQVTTSGVDKLVGSSPAMRALKQRLTQILEAERRLAGGAAPPVLILGETGTGKELIARALHFDGVRRAGAFVEINTAALPTNLIEAELFGFERGAFTDAREPKPGLVETADGGTLFLDEIGEVDLAVQAKLLKLIEDGVARRLGSVRERHVDLRLVSATNAQLEQRVREGRFRADLYYRLNVITIEVPPLRARGRDVLEIADQFLDFLARRYSGGTLKLSDAARERLLDYHWPGNVRELRNVIEQAAMLADRPEIDAADLALRPMRTAGASNGGTIADIEREMIRRALATNAGNISNAARELGISRDTLRYRIKKYAIEVD